MEKTLSERSCVTASSELRIRISALTEASTYRLACGQGYAAEKQIRTARSVGGVEHPLDLAVLA